MESFRSKILAEATALMENEQQHQSSMKSWNGPETKGFEVVFEGQKNGIPVVSGVLGQIFISQDGDFEAIINGYVVKDSLRSVVSTFSLTPSANLSDELTAGLSALTIAVTSTLTISHLLMIPTLRDKILKELSGKEAARLAQINTAIRATVTSVQVDRTFWKDKLRRDIGAEKVQQAIAKSRRFFKVYGEAQTEKMTQERQNRRDPLMVHDPLAVPIRGNVPHPGRRPLYDPDSEWYNPQGGFLPPGARPHNPNLPVFMGPGGGRLDPDLNPFAGGFNQNIFGGPRGGRHPGDPFRRGGSGFDGPGHGFM